MRYVWHKERSCRSRRRESRHPVRAFAKRIYQDKHKKNTLTYVDVSLKHERVDHFVARHQNVSHQLEVNHHVQIVAFILRGRYEASCVTRNTTSGLLHSLCTLSINAIVCRGSARNTYPRDRALGLLGCHRHQARVAICRISDVCR